MAQPGMDDAPLLSARWFRVAGLRPLLDPQATVQRMAVRGAVWQVLTRPDGSRSVRLNASAWVTVGRCDGQHTLQRLWEITLAELRDDAPTQDELIGLLARLHQSGLLSFDRVPDFDAVPAEPAQDRRTADGPRQSLLAWRFPLGCPDVWLARLAGRLRWLFTPVALLLWLAGMAVVGFVAWPQAEVLSAQLREGLGTPRWLAWAWLVYPVMKVLHEVAHGLVIRHWGAQVPQWGVTLLMGTPVPYVDAGAAVGSASSSASPPTPHDASSRTAAVITETLRPMKFCTKMRWVAASTSRPCGARPVAASTVFTAGEVRVEPLTG